MKTKLNRGGAEALRDPFRGRFETIRLGDRVAFVCGPGESHHYPLRAGKVYGKMRGKWGRGLRIKCDDFTLTPPIPSDSPASTELAPTCFKIAAEAAAPGTSGGRQWASSMPQKLMSERIRITTKEGETIVLEEGAATFLMSPAGLELLISRAAKFRRPPQSLFQNETQPIRSDGSDAHAA